MSLQKGTFIGAGALCALGLILRTFGVSSGLDLMILAVLGAVIGLAFTQRTTQNQLSTTRRNLTQRLREVGDAQARREEAVDELVTLQRTTLWYVKNRPGSGGPTADLTRTHRNSSRSGLAGRSSTPDVTNAEVGMSFAMALDPERKTAIGGVLPDASRTALPDDTTFIPFMPHRAVELLDGGQPLDLIVIDEAAFAHHPWAAGVGPTGTDMMKDLLDAVRIAYGQGIQTFLLPFETVPDIHTTALRRAPVLPLPLTEDAALQTSGAPLASTLRSLKAIAERRGPA